MRLSSIQKTIVEIVKSVYPRAKIERASLDIDGRGYYFHFVIPHESVAIEESKKEIDTLRKLLKVHGVNKKELPFDGYDIYEDGWGLKFIAAGPKQATLQNKLIDLADQGCCPGIYSRGNLWRVHVNIGGNFWEDSETPLEALIKAEKSWIAAGCPMDGRASENEMIENIPKKEDPITSVNDFEINTEYDDDGVTRIVSLIFLKALRTNADSIRMTEYEKKFMVQFKIDHAWREVESPPRYLSNKIINRIVNMSHMDEDEHTGSFEIGCMGKTLIFDVGKYGEENFHWVEIDISEKDEE